MGVREGWRDTPAGGRKGHPIPLLYLYARVIAILWWGVVGVGNEALFAVQRG